MLIFIATLIGCNKLNKPQNTHQEEIPKPKKLWSISLLNNLDNDITVYFDKNLCKNIATDSLDISTKKSLNCLINVDALITHVADGLGFEIAPTNGLNDLYIFQFYYNSTLATSESLSFKNWLVAPHFAFNHYLNEDEKNIQLVFCSTEYYESHNRSCTLNLL